MPPPLPCRAAARNDELALLDRRIDDQSSTRTRPTRPRRTLAGVHPTSIDEADGPSGPPSRTAPRRTPPNPTRVTSSCCGVSPAYSAAVWTSVSGDLAAAQGHGANGDQRPAPATRPEHRQQDAPTGRPSAGPRKISPSHARPRVPDGWRNANRPVIGRPTAGVLPAFAAGWPLPLLSLLNKRSGS